MPTAYDALCPDCPTLSGRTTDGSLCSTTQGLFRPAWRLLLDNGLDILNSNQFDESTPLLLSHKLSPLCRIAQERSARHPIRCALIWQGLHGNERQHQEGNASHHARLQSEEWIAALMRAFSIRDDALFCELQASTRQPIATLAVTVQQ